MSGEAGLVAGVGGGVVGPGPAAEAGFLVIGDGIVDFLFGVHDKGAVLSDRLVYGQTLQQQEFTGLDAIFQLNVGISIQRQGVADSDGLFAGFDGVAFKIEQAAGTTGIGCRQRPAGTGGHFDGLDHHLVLWIGSP